MQNLALKAILLIVVLIFSATACATGSEDIAPNAIEGPAFILFYTNN